MNSLLQNEKEAIEQITALIKNRSGISPKRKAECIYCVVIGMTTKQAARHLGLSKNTVDGYILRVRRIFQCRNRFELITLILNETD